MCKQIFEYDYVASKNPPGTLKEFEACLPRNGGLCSADINFEASKIFTYNLYAAFRDEKKRFPIFLQFEVAGHASTLQSVFMGFTVGQGQLAFFSKAIVTPGEGVERTTARLEIVRHGADEATVVPNLLD